MDSVNVKTLYLASYIFADLVANNIMAQSF